MPDASRLIYAIFGLCLSVISHGASSQEQWGYVAHWMGDSWRQHNLSHFQRLFFFDLEAGSDGRIRNANGWPEKWTLLRETAASAAVPLDPTITILGRDRFIEIFSSTQNTERLLNDIETVAKLPGTEGIHIDVEVFEPVDPVVLEAFQEFVEQLRSRINPLSGKLLSAFVPATYRIYGPKALRTFDALIVQGYDAHWRTGPTSGPIALQRGESPVAWENAARYLRESGVENSRILFSTPAFGYEWPTESNRSQAATRGPGRTITFAPVPAGVLSDIRTSALGRIAGEEGIRRHRDRNSGAPWYAFMAEDGWWQGWYDDPVALGERLQLIQKEGFRGVALFPIGYDAGLLEEFIFKAFRRPPPP